MIGPTRTGDTGSIRFTFDGKALLARPGDTLAAALLANGIGLVARSFKYHRPRGIMTAGIEEPNALVTIGSGGRTEPNTRATDVFVYDGMVASSQNSWPSLAFDAGAVLGLASKALPPGFYYKTFFGSAKRWMFYEYFIRRAAGLGVAPTEADPDRFAQRAAFCDVLVVGAGPAGLEAALDAAEAGERVMLVEQDRILAPSLARDPQELDANWIGNTATRIRELGGRILLRTTAAGYWDDNLIVLTERLAEPGEQPANGLVQRLWHVRAKRVVLATGALERPLAFAHNDRPGVMLSQAVRTYIRRFGVVPGRRVVIATNNDDAYLTAAALRDAGADVVAVLDTRPAPEGANSGFMVHNDAMPQSTSGARHCLKSVSATVGSKPMTFSADLLAMSGGFTPVVHLHMQAGGAALDWDAGAQAFLPGAARQNVQSV
ncbi:2Fe-2S iron-sulfur cluster-binding protein, partial [Novosphingobium sp.]|uniref:2Fe-2S iron-sulfur cluster-binding protein n=1 Tax=Novosphingobium sp. TaxID=1874826 RepID=UPI0025CCA185